MSYSHHNKTHYCEHKVQSLSTIFIEKAWLYIEKNENVLLKVVHLLSEFTSMTVLSRPL